MKTNTVLAIAATAFTAAANARRPSIPKATASFAFPFDGMSPKPTNAPGLRDLKRRQNSDTSSDETFLFAPDNTCGYIDGRAGASYTCGTAATCVFITSSRGGGIPGNVACCDPDYGCGARIDCVDYESYYSSTVCNDGCAADAYTLKCLDTAAPYCNTISFDGNIIDYWCNAIEISTVQEATTTYAGQDDAVEWTPVALTDESSSIEFSATDDVAAPTISATADPNDDDSGDDSSDDTGDDSGSDNSSDGDSGSGGKKKKGGSSTPIGPIVGGVVGGVAALAIVGLGIFFCLRKKKKNAAKTPEQQPQAYAAPPMQQQGHQSQGFNNTPPPHQSYYDPSFGTSPAGTQGYSPNTQYSQPNGQQPGGFYAVSTQHTGSPDPLNPSSPTASHMTDPRMSQVGSSPTPSYGQAFVPPPGQQQPPPHGFQPQGGVIHEASAQSSDNHRGTMSELA